MSAKQIFEKAFNSIPEEMTIVEQREWSNGTGYYDGLVRGKNAPRLTPGTVRKFISANNRRVIVIGTALGNAAVFDRYSEKDGEYPGPCVMNLTKPLEALKIFDNGAVCERDMCTLVGSWGRTVDDNIGRHLDYMIKVIDEARQEHDKKYWEV